MKLHIKLHPNSSQEKIAKITGNKYEIWIKQKPIVGKANIYLEKLLKKYFKRNVKIVYGLKSKNKIVELFDIK